MAMLEQGNLMWDFDEDHCIAAELTSPFARKIANLKWQAFGKVYMKNWKCNSEV